MFRSFGLKENPFSVSPDQHYLYCGQSYEIALAELNQLLNLENARGKLVQIVLAGQPELEEKLRRPELRALRQRIMVRCRLPLLTLEETGEYIASRLRGAGGTGEHIFPPKTIE